MVLTINGEETNTEGCETVGDLLRILEVDASQVAVLVNEDVVPSAGRASRGLRDGDRVELVTFLAGG